MPTIHAKRINVDFHVAAFTSCSGVSAPQVAPTRPVQVSSTTRKSMLLSQTRYCRSKRCCRRVSQAKRYVCEFVCRCSSCSRPFISIRYVAVVSIWKGAERGCLAPLFQPVSLRGRSKIKTRSRIARSNICRTISTKQSAQSGARSGKKLLDLVHATAKKKKSSFLSKDRRGRSLQTI